MAGMRAGYGVRTALLLVWVLAGCAGPPRPRFTTVSPPPLDVPPSGSEVSVVPPPSVPGSWISLHRWAAGQGLPAPRITSTNPVTCELQVGSGLWRFRAGTTVAQWDGLQIRLGHAPQWQDQELWLHELDIAKQIEPLRGPTLIRLGRPPRVVLDPGHGGQNTGARSVVDGRWEKEFTLDWALRVAALLSAQGWEVILTRKTDTDVSLTERVALTEKSGADLFLSLHFNSVNGTNHTGGLETYCLTPTGLPSTLTREFDDPVMMVHPNNAHDAANLQLAVRLHRALLEETGLADRGVRRARFMTVLQGQNRPAVLLEGGYLSHPEEARRIADPQFRQRLAEGVARALMSLAAESQF